MALNHVDKLGKSDMADMALPLATATLVDAGHQSPSDVSVTSSAGELAVKAIAYEWQNGCVKFADF